MTRLINLVLLALLASSVSAGSYKKDSKKLFNCVFSYLKDNDFLTSAKYSTFEPEVDESDDCETRTNGLREEFYSKIEANIEQDKDFADASECIMENLRNFYTGEDYLEKYIYINDKSMSNLKRNLALNGVFGSIEQKMLHAQEFCAPEKTFGEWFDELYGEDPVANATETEEEEIEDLQEDYCQRKYLVDTKFIDTQTYNVTVNPKKIDTTDLDCKTIYAEGSYGYNNGLKSQFESALKTNTKKLTRCFVNTIRKGNYTETLLKVWVFSEIRLTEEQRITERAGFITFMTDLYLKVNKCI